MGLSCKRCGSTDQVENGLMRGKQRYRCKGCGLNFTDTPPPGKSRSASRPSLPLRPDHQRPDPTDRQIE